MFLKVCLCQHFPRFSLLEESLTEAPIDTAYIPERFRPVINAMADAGRQLAMVLRRAGPGDSPEDVRAGSAGVYALEDRARALYRDALRAAGIRWYVSGDGAGARELGPFGDWAVALSPLDAAGNIDLNLPCGTIFSVLGAEDTVLASFLRPARDQLAAGYILFGPRCCLMLTFGDGTQMYLLNPDSNRFELLRERVVLPGDAAEVAPSSADRHWPALTRPDAAAASRDQGHGPRPIAGLVAETHRILMRGGVVACPLDSLLIPSLRRVIDCAPIAFLIEQAGGRATNGSEPIMAGQARSLDEYSGLIFGSPDRVARLAARHDPPGVEASALFGHRGLFRA